MCCEMALFKSAVVNMEGFASVQAWKFLVTCVPLRSREGVLTDPNISGLAFRPNHGASAP